MTALRRSRDQLPPTSAPRSRSQRTGLHLGEWQTEDRGGAGTDVARGMLTGVTGGIQPSRLSTAAETRTRATWSRRIAELFDGTQIGDTGVAQRRHLRRAGAAPDRSAGRSCCGSIVDYLRTQQLADGGWSWNSSPSATGGYRHDGVGGRGVLRGRRQDRRIPTSTRRFALMHSLQDPATGG